MHPYVYTIHLLRYGTPLLKGKTTASYRILNSGLETFVEQKWWKKEQQTRIQRTLRTPAILMVKLHLSVCQMANFLSILLTCGLSPSPRVFLLFAASMFHRFKNFSWKYISTQKTSFSVSFYLLRLALCDLWLTLPPKKICTNTHGIIWNSQGPFYKVHLYHFLASFRTLTHSLSVRANIILTLTIRFEYALFLLILHCWSSIHWECFSVVIRFFLWNAGGCCCCAPLDTSYFWYKNEWKWKDVESTWRYKDDDDDEDILHNKA